MSRIQRTTLNRKTNMNTRHITPETAFEPENRRLYLGGTDISAIAGFNNFKTCYETWLEKTGQAIKEDDKENDLFIWGHLLEPVIALEWLRRNPEWEIVSENEFSVDPEFDFLCSNTDRVIRHKVTGERAILECKTVASSGFKHWKLGVPYTYYTQGQHYLGISGYDRVIYACLVMDSRALETFEIVRDDVFIEEIRTLAVNFWTNNVLTGIAPDKNAYDWSLTKAVEKFVVADETDIELHKSYVQFQSVIKANEASLESLKDRVKERLQDNNVMQTTEGKFLFTWNGSDQEKVDSKKLKVDFPDAYTATVKTSYVRRLLVK